MLLVTLSVMQQCCCLYFASQCFVKFNRVAVSVPVCSCWRRHPAHPRWWLLTSRQAGMWRRGRGMMLMRWLQTCWSHSQHQNWQHGTLRSVGAGFRWNPHGMHVATTHVANHMHQTGTTKYIHYHCLPVACSNRSARHLKQPCSWVCRCNPLLC